jgi:hypothetical protein
LNLFHHAFTADGFFGRLYFLKVGSGDFTKPLDPRISKPDDLQSLRFLHCDTSSHHHQAMMPKMPIENFQEG